MILDYNYNQRYKKFSISYVNERGTKNILNFNVNRFKTFYYTPSGRYKSWEGANCDERWTEKPSMFDIKTYIEELDPKYKNLLQGKTFPKLYTFDIEVHTGSNDLFPEPSEARYPVTTISICSPKCDTVVLGIRKLSDEENKYVEDSYSDYIDNTEFFHTLGLEKPKVKYIYFEKEKDMLEYFLQNIVAKVPVLAGWNSLLFDWHYITTRIRNYFPELSVNLASCTKQIKNKNYQDMKGDKYSLPMPLHTLVIDMMDIIDQFDMVVLPIKESKNLDYIAHESMGINKIQYNGTLIDLYNNDFAKYVFYNAVDSLLVQLIDKRFKTMNNIYLQSLYCTEKIGNCFSKIALSEALVFKDFYEQGIKIVYQDLGQPDRGELQGAYVKQPRTGKYEFIACNDFASLYPSTIVTCNLSYDNFIPKEFTEEELEKYRKDPNYFVSVNGNVYKNDKEYSFKRIQRTLKANRNISKYLSKKMDAKTMLDLEHIMQGKHPDNQVYDDNIVEAIKKIGYDVKCTDDLYKIENKDEFKYKLRDEITYYTGNEQAMKLLGNSMYGGSSHVAFYWFNMKLANDITGESRNLIHMMERHLGEIWYNEWDKIVAQFPQWNIKLKPNWKSFLHPHENLVYGDTDSLYSEYNSLLNTIEGIEKMTTQQKLDIIIKINLDFLNQHNKEYIENYYKTRHAHSIHEFELETVAKSGVWLDVKKRYAQILLWKDGKYFDMDNLPMKVKGLEMIKSSYPAFARESLKRLVRYFLEEPLDYLIQKMNIKTQEEKQKFLQADLEDISGSVKINNYTKYILDDKGPMLRVASKCPYNVRAAGNYNQIRNHYHLDGEPIYGGKVKWYAYRVPGSLSKVDYFAYVSTEYPEWAKKYAPIDKREMFQRVLLDPLNRIITAVGYPQLEYDGNIALSLF